MHSVLHLKNMNWMRLNSVKVSSTNLRLFYAFLENEICENIFLLYFSRLIALDLLSFFSFSNNYYQESRYTTRSRCILWSFKCKLILFSFHPKEKQTKMKDKEGCETILKSSELLRWTRKFWQMFISLLIYKC